MTCDSHSLTKNLTQWTCEAGQHILTIELLVTLNHLQFAVGTVNQGTTAAWVNDPNQLRAVFKIDLRFIFDITNQITWRNNLDSKVRCKVSKPYWDFFILKLPIRRKGNVR